MANLTKGLLDCQAIASGFDKGVVRYIDTENYACVVCNVKVMSGIKTAQSHCSGRKHLHKLASSYGLDSTVDTTPQDRLVVTSATSLVETRGDDKKIDLSRFDGNSVLKEAISSGTIIVASQGINSFTCKICNVVCTGPEPTVSHIKGKLHIKKKASTVPYQFIKNNVSVGDTSTLGGVNAAFSSQNTTAVDSLNKFDMNTAVDDQNNTPASSNLPSITVNSEENCEVFVQSLGGETPTSIPDLSEVNSNKKLQLRKRRFEDSNSVSQPEKFIKLGQLPVVCSRTVGLKADTAGSESINSVKTNENSSSSEKGLGEGKTLEKVLDSVALGANEEVKSRQPVSVNNEEEGKTKNDCKVAADQNDSLDKTDARWKLINRTDWALKAADKEDDVLLLDDNEELKFSDEDIEALDYEYDEFDSTFNHGNRKELNSSSRIAHACERTVQNTVESDISEDTAGPRNVTSVFHTNPATEWSGAVPEATDDTLSVSESEKKDDLGPPSTSATEMCSKSSPSNTDTTQSKDDFLKQNGVKFVGDAFICTVCNISVPHLTIINSHLMGKKHKKMVVNWKPAEGNASNIMSRLGPPTGSVLPSLQGAIAETPQVVENKPQTVTGPGKDDLVKRTIMDRLGRFKMPPPLHSGSASDLPPDGNVYTRLGGKIFPEYLDRSQTFADDNFYDDDFIVNSEPVMQIDHGLAHRIPASSSYYHYGRSRGRGRGFNRFIQNNYNRVQRPQLVEAPAQMAFGRTSETGITHSKFNRRSLDSDSSDDSDEDGLREAGGSNAEKESVANSVQ